MAALLDGFDPLVQVKTPVVCGVASLGYDHTELLGEFSPYLVARILANPSLKRGSIIFNSFLLCSFSLGPATPTYGSTHFGNASETCGLTSLGRPNDSTGQAIHGRASACMHFL